MITLTSQVHAAEGSRPELLAPLYAFALVCFFLYCYPIGKWTQALERRVSAEVLARSCRCLSPGSISASLLRRPRMAGSRAQGGMTTRALSQDARTTRPETDSAGAWSQGRGRRSDTIGSSTTSIGGGSVGGSPSASRRATRSSVGRMRAQQRGLRDAPAGYRERQVLPEAP